MLKRPHKKKRTDTESHYGKRPADTSHFAPPADSIESRAGSDPALRERIDRARREYYEHFFQMESWSASGFQSQSEGGRQVFGLDIAELPIGEEDL